MGTKADFIRAVLVRLCPESDRADAAIDRGEALWEALQRRGYATSAPASIPPPASTGQELNWDGLPKVKAATFTGAGTLAYRLANQPPEPKPKEQRLREALADCKTWEGHHRLKPEDEEIREIYEKAKAKYEAIKNE